MGNKVTIELKGLRELDNALRALPVEIKRSKIIYRALHDGARVISAEAKRRAPLLQDAQDKRRQRGAIRSGITQAASRSQDFEVDIRVRNRGYIFAPGPDTRSNAKSAQRAGNPNYWWLVEFGTSKMSARPFLRPAFEARKVAAAEAIRESLRKGIRAVTAALGWKMAA
jgi:HK97 gp10 family phage protein